MKPLTREIAGAVCGRQRRLLDWVRTFEALVAEAEDWHELSMSTDGAALWVGPNHPVNGLSCT